MQQNSLPPQGQQMVTINTQQQQNVGQMGIQQRPMQHQQQQMVMRVR